MPDIHRAGRLGLATLVATALALFAGHASATVNYPDYVGTQFTYSGLQETSNPGDAEPLWNAPVGSANDLALFPSAFIAQSAGGGVTSTGSQFQAMVTSNGPGDYIDSIVLEEFGDASIIGAGGTTATGTFASMAGFVTVLESMGGPITPVVIPFVGTFTPSDTLDFVGDFGTTLWSAIVTIDVAGAVTGATKVQISWDNDLMAASELGTTALIQKKVATISTVPVPEPSTALLVGGGLLILGVRRRRTGAA